KEENSKNPELQTWIWLIGRWNPNGFIPISSMLKMILQRAMEIYPSLTLPNPNIQSIQSISEDFFLAFGTIRVRSIGMSRRSTILLIIRHHILCSQMNTMKFNKLFSKID
ncbi:hypothetical protein SSS_09817, partial [Sarcoptes scabiei]